MNKKGELSSVTKKVLSLTKDQFNDYIDKWEKDFKEEHGEEIEEELDEVVQSAGQPNFDKILFDERTKGWVRIQYGRKVNDYIYHIFFKKNHNAEEHVVCDKILQAIAKLLPREPEKIVSPPMEVTDFAEPYYIECYSLLVKDITRFSGSRRMMEEVFVNELLDRLCELYPQKQD